VSQKLFRALARPLKVDLDPCPVISRLEKGAELKRTTPFGAPRMLKSEGRWISNQDEWLPGLVQDTPSDVTTQAQPLLRYLKLAPVRRLDHPPPLFYSLSGSRHKTLHVEDAFFAQNQIDCSTELRGQNRQSLALAVLSGESSKMFLAFRVVAKEE
jgi:hypothetical protein